MSVYWGVNLSHDGSICQLNQNGEIDWVIEEERYSRTKNLSLPFSPIPYIDFKDKINTIQISGLYEFWDKKCLEETAKIFSILVEKFYNKQKNFNSKKSIDYELFLEHHTYHAACGFYNSGFEESAVLVVDGMGNYVNDQHHEVETIYSFSYPNIVSTHQVHTTNSFMHSSSHQFEKLPIGIGMMYSAIADYFGFGSLGSGKVMGMSAYGKEDPNIKSFIVDNKLDSLQFYRTRYGINFIPYDYVNYEGISITSQHPKIQNLYNLAYRLQKDFENYMINLILYTLQITGSENLVLTGGCALNCVANYKYLDILPKDVKLYVEPISTDAGTAVGLAKLQYYHQTQSNNPKPLTSLYLGIEK